LPGVRYRAIRGIFDFHGLPNRRRGRSKVGTPKPKNVLLFLL